MKIIRWLLSHTFLILLIVAVIYGYMFWGNLAGEDTPAGKAIAYLSGEFVEVERFVDAVKSKQAELAKEKPANEKPTIQASSDQASTEVAAVAEPLAPAPAVQPPASISYSHNQMRVKQNSAGVIESENNRQQRSAVTTLAPGNTDGKFVSAEVERQLSNVDEHGKVIDASQTSEAVKKSWITARKSFYQRDYEKSVQSYQEVIDNTEDNFDAYGELGNVYFNQGKREQAASAYFEAAAILVKKGQGNRAKSLMGLLRHLDKSKADELQALLNPAQS